MIAEAQAQGLFTDEDVIDRVSRPAAVPTSKVLDVPDVVL
jgi:hypothetical protein